MPVVVKRPIKAPDSEQLAEERPAAAKKAVEVTKADRPPNAEARIKAELDRVENRRAGQRELKSRRRELRLTPSADDLITCAMQVLGLTAGDLAYHGALKLLEDHRRLLLRLRDRGRSSRHRR
jgi:hypothetical protein